MERNSEQMVRYLQQRYTYDAECGVVRNRKNHVVKGFDNGCGYLKLNAKVDGCRHEIRLHRLVWALVYGRFPKQIDHINGDGMDNRLENLRECSIVENNANRMYPWKPNAETGVPGVRLNRRSNGRYYRTDAVFKYENIQIYSAKSPYMPFHDSTLLGKMYREE